MLERSIARAQATRSVSWLRRKVQWTFRASSAERRLAVRTALRSYTLFGLSGCVVKFSFLVAFSFKNSIRQQDYYYRSAFILLDQAIPISHY